MNYENTYVLRTEESNDGMERYIVRFRDVHEILQEIEVSYELYAELEGFSISEQSAARKDRRRIEQVELTDAELYDRAVHRPKSVEDMVLESLRNKELRQAIAELPETQRRRFLLYHEGFTMQKIAEIEQCKKQSIDDTIKLAASKIRGKLKFFWI